MSKMYFSVDVETSGKTPGKYSMLSFGACVVGDIKKQFYRELKPLNGNYITEAMKVGCLGLECLENVAHIDEYNPRSDKFKPELVLERLKILGHKPEHAMHDFNEWVLSSTPERHKPILAAAPVLFDGMFISWYFDNFFDGENPFGFSGEDMNSVYRGVKKDMYSGMKNLCLRKEDLSHNALEDAIQQAKEFERVLKEMN